LSRSGTSPDKVTSFWDGNESRKMQGHPAVSPRENSAPTNLTKNSISSKESIVISNIPILPIEIDLILTKNSRRCRTSFLKVSYSSRAFALCHALRIANPSSQEMRFIEFVITFDLNSARLIAAKLRLRCQRPLQALLSMMSERGKNYSVRSAKRKRPSNSATASRKRSSGG
jgi:hypothetical protein